MNTNRGDVLRAVNRAEANRRAAARTIQAVLAEFQGTGTIAHSLEEILGVIRDRVDRPLTLTEERVTADAYFHLQNEMRRTGRGRE